MRPQETRLKKTKDFQGVFSKGKGFREGNLFLKVGVGSEGTTKFGIVVSKKVAKQAVVRNRIRRLLKEALRQEAEYIKEGAHAAIVVFPGFQEESFQEVQKSVHRLLEKASLFQ